MPLWFPRLRAGPGFHVDKRPAKRPKSVLQEAASSVQVLQLKHWTLPALKPDDSAGIAFPNVAGTDQMHLANLHNKQL